MPFTPFHIGPGLAVKAITGRYFSILAFGISQVAMDIEPLIALARGSTMLHGHTHTCIGATIIATVTWIFSPPICRIILKKWNRELHHYGVGWLCSPVSPGWFATATGAFVGAYSHVALDCMMHADIQPFWPFSGANRLFAVLSLNMLYWWCVILGVLGVGIWFLTALIHHKRQ